MAIKKFLSLDKLTEYDNLLKEEISTNHYTKTEVDNMIDDMELITVDDIDTICGSTIQVATLSEVAF